MSYHAFEAINHISRNKKLGIDNKKPKVTESEQEKTRNRTANMLSTMYHGR